MCVAALPALAIASAVVSAAGTMYSGMAANAQGKYAQQVANQNARLENERVKDTYERGRREAQLLYRRVAQTKGEQTAAMAANGIDTAFGSALVVQRDTAMMGAEDAYALSRNVENEAKGYEINAANYRSEGAAARMKGKNAMTGSLFSAGGSLLEGVSQYKQIQAKFGSG